VGEVSFSHDATSTMIAIKGDEIMSTEASRAVVRGT